MASSKRRRKLESAGLVLAVAATLDAALASAATTVSIYPAEIQDLLANPDMGWQTFQTISDTNVTTAFTKNTDQNTKSGGAKPWIPTSVMYVRPTWDEMESSEGTFTGWLGSAVSAADSAGQTTAMRPIVTMRWPQRCHSVPLWVRSVSIG